MCIKKIAAAVMAVVLLLACLPVMASAAGDPVTLFVGEKEKSGDNLIEMYKSTGYVIVYAIDKTTSAYYTVTKEEDVGYVLTFYNNYNMSETVEYGGYLCGLYCDGDLTVRINGSVNFDADTKDYNNTYGWVVEGDLTVEGSISNASVYVSGSRANHGVSDGSIGIKADTLLLNKVSVNAFGGYAAVEAEEALVMNNATLNANTSAAMLKDGKPDFAYGVVTDNYLQFGGIVTVSGDVKIDAFYFRGGSNHFDEKVVVYGREYKFAEHPYSGDWSETFSLFRDPSLIPHCMKVSVGSSVAKVDGNRVRLNRRGSTSMELYVRCGSAILTLDTTEVQCAVRWWQWIPYLLSGAWIDGVLGR